jgi:hypothetical protein
MKVILVNLHDGTKDDLKDHKPKENTMLSYIEQWVDKRNEPIKVFEVSDKATLNGYETIDWMRKRPIQQSEIAL